MSEKKLLMNEKNMLVLVNIRLMMMMAIFFFPDLRQFDLFVCRLSWVQTFIVYI